MDAKMVFIETKLEKLLPRFTNQIALDFQQVLASAYSTRITAIVANDNWVYIFIIFGPLSAFALLPSPPI
jgi:hypothetical protein